MTVTRVATSDTTSITVRGRDLVDDLIGRHSFTEILHCRVCGRMPDPAQTRVLDACLVTLMEHGLNPGTLIARLMAGRVPDQIRNIPYQGPQGHCEVTRARPCPRSG